MGFGLESQDCCEPKAQLISKANCQAEDSSKKQTNEFVFTCMRRVFVRFLEESSARKKTFRDYLTFNTRFSFRNQITWIIVFPKIINLASIFSTKTITTSNQL